MNILHIVTGMGEASGVTVFVRELTNELQREGHSVEIVTNLGKLNGTDLRRYDVVHIHGLWSSLLHRAAVSARQKGVPVVWSPHGMLQKWALRNKWWKKIPALVFYQWKDLRSAVLLHATAPSEVEDIRRLGLRNKVVVAPLGVRIPSAPPSPSSFASKSKTLLFVSRVQRKKGLPNLIEAWSRIGRDDKTLTEGWQVRIVGPDEDNHIAELKAQCDRLGLAYSPSTSSSFTFTGPKYGADLAAEYDKADLFVLPTHSENFGSVVIEALAHGVPVITTKEAPWAELEECKCGWWIDDNVSALTDALRTAIDPSNGRTVLREMGLRGRTLVESRYTWAAVAKTMIQGYGSVA